MPRPSVPNTDTHAQAVHGPVCRDVMAQQSAGCPRACWGWAEGRGCLHIPAGPDLPVTRNRGLGLWPFKHQFKVSSLK